MPDDHLLAPSDPDVRRTTEPSGRGGDGGDLGAVVAVLRRRAWIIVLAVVATVAAAVLIAQLQEKQYESTSTLQFRAVYLDVQLSGVPLQVPGDADRDAETNLRTVSLRAIRARAAERLGQGMTASDLEGHLTIAAEGKSNLVSITATAPSPRRAARIADVVASEVVAFRRELVQRQVRQAERELAQQFRRTNSPERRRVISRQRAQLRLVRSVQTGDVQRLERGNVPNEPASPKPVRSAVLGGFIGLLLGLALAFGAEQLDRRVRRPRQLADITRLPLLASIPRSAALKRGEALKNGLPPAEAEAFRILRANLRHSGPTTGLRSVMLTSADTEAGKTTVATHLAAAAAAAGQNVLVVEADLRRPKLAERLGLRGDKGLATALRDDESVSLDRVQTVQTARDGVTFDVLVAGRASSGDGALLDSPKMEELLGRATASYDLTIVDAPPPALVADAIGLLVRVDGVVVVGRLGHESEEAIRTLRGELSQLEARPVGVVATFTAKPAKTYGSQG